MLEAGLGVNWTIDLKAKEVFVRRRNVGELAEPQYKALPVEIGIKNEGNDTKDKAAVQLASVKLDGQRKEPVPCPSSSWSRPRRDWRHIYIGKYIIITGLCLGTSRKCHYGHHSVILAQLQGETTSRNRGY